MGHRIGDIQVADYTEYGEGRSGFIFEQFGYWGGSEPCWALPDWEERGADTLSGPFASREDAVRAMRDFRQ